MAGFRPALTSRSRLKPIGPQQIDWVNPITRDMTDCLIWNEGGGVPVNLASPQIITTVTGTPKWTMSPAGLAGYSTGGAYYNIPDHGNIAAAGFSMRILFRPVTWSAGGFDSLVEKSISVGTREIILTCDVSGNISVFTLGFTNVGTATTAMTAGSVWDLVITKIADGTVNYYVNGVFISNSGIVAGTAGQATPLTWGASPGSSGGPPDAEYITSQIWKRALSPSEIWQLYVEPYNFLIETEDNIPMFSPPDGSDTKSAFYTPQLDGRTITQMVGY